MMVWPAVVSDFNVSEFSPLTDGPSLDGGRSLDLIIHPSSWLPTAGSSFIVMVKLLVSFSNQGLSLIVLDW